MGRDLDAFTHFRELDEYFVSLYPFLERRKGHQRLAPEGARHALGRLVFFFSNLAGGLDLRANRTCRPSYRPELQFPKQVKGATASKAAAWLFILFLSSFALAAQPRIAAAHDDPAAAPIDVERLKAVDAAVVFSGAGVVHLDGREVQVATRGWRVDPATGIESLLVETSGGSVTGLLVSAITRRGSHVLATIYLLGGESYEISCSDVDACIVRKRLSQTLSCSVSSPDAKAPVHAASRSSRHRAVRSAERVVIHVGLLYDEEYDKTLSQQEIELRFAHDLDLANATLVNSGLGWARFEPAGIRRLARPENLQTEATIYWLADSAAVAILRKELRADIVAFYAKRRPHDNWTSGVAFRPTPRDVGPESGYLVVVQDDIYGGSFLVVHELGHTIGGRHNPEDSVVSPADTVPYAFDFRVCGKDGFRGALSMNCPSGSVPTLPFFSNLGVPHRGITVGVPDRQDNARAMRELIPAVANYLP